MGAEKAQKLATLYRALQPLPVRRLVLGRDQGAEDVADATAGAVGGDEGEYLNDDEEFDVDADSILHQSSDSD